MSERGALIRASLLGGCLMTIGACFITLVGATPAEWFWLLITAIVCLWKLIFVVMGLVFFAIGIVWFLVPARALDTIDRNNPRRVS